MLSASPQEWKKILRKGKQIPDGFYAWKDHLQQGSKVGVLTIAPHANTFVDVLTQTALQFPDEMSPEEFTIYRRDLREFRHLQGCVSSSSAFEAGMQIHVKGYLTLREQMGSASTFELPENSTLRDLLQLLPAEIQKAVEMDLSES